jgi:hypothetical protein
LQKLVLDFLLRKSLTSSSSNRSLIKQFVLSVLQLDIDHLELFALPFPFALFAARLSFGVEVQVLFAA